MDTLTEKKRVIELIERLEPAQITTSARFLEFLLLPPVERSVATAPVDDEPITADDRRRFAQGQVWFAERGGKGIPMNDVLTEFGLKPEDLPLLK